MLLIKNEFQKIKRLKFVYILLFLSFIPYIFNTIAMFFSTNESVWNYYFFVYNQYATLFPALVFIFAGAFFHNEFQNKTTLSWFSYPQSNYKLIMSKIVATVILLFTTSVLNHLVHIISMGILFSNEVGFGELSNMFVSLFIYSLLVMATVPISALIVLITKNLLSVVVIGIGSIFITTIILGAEVSVYFPFSFAWRFGMQMYESSMGYETSEQILGSAMYVLYVVLSLTGLYWFSKRTRVYS